MWLVSSNTLANSNATKHTLPQRRDSIPVFAEENVFIFWCSVCRLPCNPNVQKLGFLPHGCQNSWKIIQVAWERPLLQKQVSMMKRCRTYVSYLDAHTTLVNTPLNSNELNCKQPGLQPCIYPLVVKKRNETSFISLLIKHNEVLCQG